MGALMTLPSIISSAGEQPQRRDVAVGWIGRTEAWSGNPIAARRPLRQSIRLFRQAGELDSRVSWIPSTRWASRRPA